MACNQVLNMISMKVFLYLSICSAFTYVVAVDQHKIIEECTSANNVKMEEWLNYVNNQIKTHGILCTLKCIHEKEGSLEPNGKWNIDYMENQLNRMLLVKNSVMAQVLACISKLPPVQTCEEVTSADSCITAVKFRNCHTEFPVTREENFEFKKNLGNPTVKMMCYLKCTAERDDVIDSDGNTNLPLLNQIVDGSRHMTQEEKEKVKKCFSEVPTMKSCEEYRSFHQCTLDMHL